MLPVCDVIPPRKTPFVLLALIVACGAAFLYLRQLDVLDLIDLTYTAGVVPASFEWTAVLTSTVVHAGWIHAAANLLFLWIFGENVEDAMGHGPFLLFLMAGAVVTATAYQALDPSSISPLIGAGGPLAAIMGAYLAMYPRSQVLMVVFLVLRVDVVEAPAIVFPVFWLLLQIVDGFTPAIAHPSDVAGALAAYGVAFAFGGLIGLFYRGRVWMR